MFGVEISFLRCHKGQCFLQHPLPGVGPSLSNRLGYLSVDGLTLVLAGSKKNKIFLQRLKEKGLNMLFSGDLCFISIMNLARLPYRGLE